MKWPLARKQKDFVRSPCEICGFLTHAADERGRFFICPVCFWEDDEFHTDPDEPCEGPNHNLSVNQARENYRKYGAILERLASDTRPPQPNEIPANVIKAMNPIYTSSIAKARSLYANFHDVIHDWQHSERVAANASLLADEVGFKDKEFLELCALWHDAARTQGFTDGHEEAGALMAKEDLVQRGVPTGTADRVYEAIRFHKSSSNPTTTEGKIIRDADKLDIFTVARWEKCAEAGWTKEYVDDLHKTVAARGKYPDAFTFEYTRRKFSERLPEFLDYYDSIKDSLPE